MRKHCPANERIKREYLIYLKEALRYSEQTIDSVAMAIARFEHENGYKDFKRFHIQQAIAFKRRLAAHYNTASGKPLSLATQRAMLNALRAFFIWLAAQPGYKSRFTYADADYFNLSEKDNRAAQSHTARPFPSLEQVQHVICSMPASNAIEQRDRALIAFTLMTACRDGAVISLKLKHIDLKNQRVILDAREVQTKFSKSFETYFMPVGDDARTIFADWVTSLSTEHFWTPSDPLFPKTLVVHQDDSLRAGGLAREHWATGNAVRRIFRTAFESAGLPYFHPHSFRHTLAQLGEKICQTPEEFKAWSQNVGHDHVMTTFKSYGKVSAPRQGELIRQLATPSQSTQHELAELLRQAASAVESKK